MSRYRSVVRSAEVVGRDALGRHARGGVALPDVNVIYYMGIVFPIVWHFARLIVMRNACAGMGPRPTRGRWDDRSMSDRAGPAIGAGVLRWSRYA